jgi:hypothetical protein
MTKKEARKHKAEWAAAVAGGRVVRVTTPSRVGDQLSFKAHPTAAQAAVACAALVADGLAAVVLEGEV